MNNICAIERVRFFNPKTGELSPVEWADADPKINRTYHHFDFPKGQIIGDHNDPNLNKLLKESGAWQ